MKTCKPIIQLLTLLLCLGTGQWAQAQSQNVFLEPGSGASITTGHQ